MKRPTETQAALRNLLRSGAELLAPGFRPVQTQAERDATEDQFVLTWIAEHLAETRPAKASVWAELLEKALAEHADAPREVKDRTRAGRSLKSRAIAIGKLFSAYAGDTVVVGGCRYELSTFRVNRSEGRETRYYFRKFVEEAQPAPAVEG